MRLSFMLALVFLCGCQSAQFALTHPLSGMHMVAKFEAKDEAPEALHAAENRGGHLRHDHAVPPASVNFERHVVSR